MQNQIYWISFGHALDGDLEISEHVYAHIPIHIDGPSLLRLIGASRVGDPRSVLEICKIRVQNGKLNHFSLKNC